MIIIGIIIIGIIIFLSFRFVALLLSFFLQIISQVSVIVAPDSRWRDLYFAEQQKRADEREERKRREMLAKKNRRCGKG